MPCFVLGFSPAAQSEPLVATATKQDLPLEQPARVRYADMLMREAYLSVSPTDLTPVEFEMAIVLTRKSALLEPENPDRWRMMLALASLVGDLSPSAVEASREALARLVKLCPTDQVIRLRRILQDVDRRETAEERAAALQKYLSPEAIKVIQTPVASRIAFDLALLDSRVGDVEAFGKDLATSLTLSPSFPAAAETAAGFVSEKVDDPVAECELLVTAALANPIETRSWSRLGALLLQEQAYGSAARVYQLALETMRLKEGVEAVIDVIVGDYALALWAAGRPDDAIQVLSQYVHDAKISQANTIQSGNIQLSWAECVAVPYSLPPLVAMLDAAIRVDSKNDGSALAISAMLASATEQAQMIKQRIQEQPREVMQSPEGKESADRAMRHAAESLVDAATVAVWLDADSAAIQACIALAQERGPLGDDAAARFAAARYLKEGDLPKALSQFEQLPTLSDATQSVRAKILEAGGDRKGAARIYLDIARGNPGTLIGVCANSRLKSLVGTGVEPSASVGKLDGIVASVPPTMERYIAGTDHAVVFRIVPESETVGAFDPIRYRMSMRNDSVLTLAVSIGGPIKEHVLLQPRISSTTNLGVDRLVPQIIPFDRAIELAPGESMSMNWDLGWTEVGLRLNQDPIAGGIVDARASSNYIASTGYFGTGTLGESLNVAQVQVDGVRVTPEWISSVITRAQDPKTDRDLVDLVLLAFAAHKKHISGEQEAIAWKAVADGFAKLPVEAQSWVLLAGPRGAPGFEATLDLARATTLSDVRVAYLLGHCTSREDGQLAAAMRAGDPYSSMAVSVLAARFQREAVRADERMRGEGVGAGAGAVEMLKEEQRNTLSPVPRP